MRSPDGQLVSLDGRTDLKEGIKCNSRQDLRLSFKLMIFVAGWRAEWMRVQGLPGMHCPGGQRGFSESEGLTAQGPNPQARFQNGAVQDMTLRH